MTLFIADKIEDIEERKKEVLKSAGLIDRLTIKYVENFSHSINDKLHLISTGILVGLFFWMLIYFESSTLVFSIGSALSLLLTCILRSVAHPLLAIAVIASVESTLDLLPIPKDLSANLILSFTLILVFAFVQMAVYDTLSRRGPRYRELIFRGYSNGERVMIRRRWVRNFKKNELSSLEQLKHQINLSSGFQKAGTSRLRSVLSELDRLKVKLISIYDHTIGLNEIDMIDDLCGEWDANMSYLKKEIGKEKPY